MIKQIFKAYKIILLSSALLTISLTAAGQTCTQDAANINSYISKPVNSYLSSMQMINVNTCDTLTKVTNVSQMNNTCHANCQAYGQSVLCSWSLNQWGDTLKCVVPPTPNANIASCQSDIKSVIQILQEVGSPATLGASIGLNSSTCLLTSISNNPYDIQFKNNLCYTKCTVNNTKNGTCFWQTGNNLYATFSCEPHGSAANILPG